MFEEYFTDYDPSYKIVFVGEWSDYEENGWIFIFCKDQQYFYLQGGYCLMVGWSPDPLFSDIDELTADEAIGMMLEWADVETTEDYAQMHDPCLFL